MLPNGLIGNLFGPMNGRRHDAALLAESGILQECEARMNTTDGQPMYLYGDPAYPLRPHLMVPYKGNLTAAQQQFNSSMSRVRETVEWGFGKTLSNFAFVDFKKNLKRGLQPVGLYYRVSVILANCHTCLYGSETSDYFNCPPCSLEEYLML